MHPLLTHTYDSVFMTDSNKLYEVKLSFRDRDTCYVELNSEKITSAQKIVEIYREHKVVISNGGFFISIWPSHLGFRPVRVTFEDREYFFRFLYGHTCYSAAFIQAKNEAAAKAVSFVPNFFLPKTCFSSPFKAEYS